MAQKSLLSLIVLLSFLSLSARTSSSQVDRIGEGGNIRITENDNVLRDEVLLSSVKSQIASLKYDGNSAAKNDFMQGLTIGEPIEQAVYNENDAAIIDSKWHLANFYQKKDGNSPLTVSPLLYEGYIESGKTNALEMLMLKESGNSTSRHTGYSLANNKEYAQGTYYLSFMVNVSPSMWSGDDNAKGFIMFNGAHTSDFKRIVCYVKKIDASNATFGLREDDVDYNSADPKTHVSYSKQQFALGKTHLIVIKYDFSTRKAELFVNPAIESIEPSSDVSIDVVNEEFNNRGIRAITLRQRRNHSQKIGGLRFAKTWHDVLALKSDDDGEQHPQGSYDYSTIASHPRLLMNKEEEILLKENLEKNPQLLALHNLIIRIANKTLAEEPLERVLEGKRLLTVSRTAIYRIFYLSYAYRMTLDQRYLDRAEEELLVVCNFSDWNPSHFLDVGEMAMAVSIGYDWLFYDLKSDTKEIIRNALIEKAFTPSKNKTYNSFLTNKANWNQVCNGGLTYAALAIYEGAKETSVEMIERSLESIKLPLNDYGPDGNYKEGYMYWAYGTTYQVMLLAALDSALGGDKDLHKIPGFMETAEYMLFMSGTRKACFNYSDSSEAESPLIPMFWFAEKSGDPSLLYVEKQKISNGDYSKSFSENRFLPALLVFANYSNTGDSKAPDKKVWVGHGDTSVAMVRTSWGDSSDLYVGVKGGKASTSHGHMDAGSFVYDACDVRWAMDLGMQNYLSLESKGIDLWNMNQDSERWNVFRYNNKAHNTLTVNDKNHLVNGAATIINTYDSPNQKGVELNMTPVFEQDLKSAQRTVLVHDDRYLEVTDVVTTKADPITKVRWSMVTSATATVENNKTFRLEKDGHILFLSFEGTESLSLMTWSTEPTTDYDEENVGTIIVGFESMIPANTQSEFTAKLVIDEFLNLTDAQGGREISHTEYFSIMGIPINMPSEHEISIKRIYYDDGSVEVEKIMDYSSN